ncbi:hypothetical protein DV737_g4450, partial [Chaetothyriales sp. CBS 132003]
MTRYPVRLEKSYSEDFDHGIASDPTKRERPNYGDPQYDFFRHRLAAHKRFDETEARHEWFKLKLDPTRQGGNSQLASNFPSTIPLPSTYQTASLAQLVTDYLSALRKHLDVVLSRKLPPVAAQAPREYILTVPAVWSQKAREDTLTFAQNAALAAGIAVFNKEIYSLFVMLAEGSTVDLISYLVDSVSPLKLQEATPGSGKACGSIFLDRIFERRLRDKLHLRSGWDEEGVVAAIQKFERTVKRNFQKDVNGPFVFRIPGLQPLPNERSNLRSQIQFSKEEMMNNIFEPVVVEVIALVQDQVRRVQLKHQRATKQVLMVGGFGQNGYLRERLEEVLDPTITVKESMKPQTSVVEGALLRLLDDVTNNANTPKIVSRAARKHCGTLVAVEYKEGIHNKSRREFNAYFESGSQVKVVDWLIRKGDIIMESTPTKYEHIWEKPVSEGRPTTITTQIYECAEDNAPVYPIAPAYQLAEVTADFRSIPETEFPRLAGLNNQTYYHIKFDIEMTYYSAKRESPNDLLELLLDSNGSVEGVLEMLSSEPPDAPSPRKKRQAATIGYQSALPFAGPKVGPASNSLTKKGKTLHLYSPEDIAAHTPCSIIHNFLPASLANDLLEELLPEVASYTSATFRLFDNIVQSPHTACFYVADRAERIRQQSDYLYNGSTVDDIRELLPVMRKVSELVREAVNEEIAKRISTHYPDGKKLRFQSPKEWRPTAAFVNCYDGPQQCVGYHSDQLSYLGPRAVIGSLSIGVAREFRVRRIVPPLEIDSPSPFPDSAQPSPRTQADIQGQISIHLPHNSLLVMHAEMQEEWKHSIAPALSIDPHPIAGNKRLNITYRWYREEFSPKYTPWCRCGVPTVLKCVQKRKETRGRYMWMCQVGARATVAAPTTTTTTQLTTSPSGKHAKAEFPTDSKGCGYFEWAEFTDDGDPIWKLDKKFQVTQKKKKQG